MAEKKQSSDTPDAVEALEKPKQQPSIGRMVHFVNGEQHLAAIITDPAYIGVPRFDADGNERSAQQALTVFPPNAPPFTTVASEDPNGAPASWHWPEYVPAT